MKYVQIMDFFKAKFFHLTEGFFLLYLLSQDLLIAGLRLTAAFFIFFATFTGARIISAYFGFTANNSFGLYLRRNRDRRKGGIFATIDPAAIDLIETRGFSQGLFSTFLSKVRDKIYLPRGITLTPGSSIYNFQPRPNHLIVDQAWPQPSHFLFFFRVTGSNQIFPVFLGERGITRPHQILSCIGKTSTPYQWATTISKREVRTARTIFHLG